MWVLLTLSLATGLPVKAETVATYDECRARLQSLAQSGEAAACAERWLLPPITGDIRQ